MAADSTETYERLLDSSLGFSNPANVDVLLGKLGINDTQSSSLMRGLQRYGPSRAVWGVKLYLNLEIFN